MSGRKKASRALRQRQRNACLAKVGLDIGLRGGKRRHRNRSTFGLLARGEVGYQPFRTGKPKVVDYMKDTHICMINQNR